MPPEVKKRLSDTLSSLQQQAISHMSTIAQFDLQGKLFATLNAAAVPDEGAIARLREVLTSQNVPDKVRRAMQGIAVSKNFISSFKTELLPQLVDLDTQYTGIKKLLGENDAGNLLEFQQTMQTAMTDLVTGMQTATQSQQSSTNVEAATAAIRKSLDNMAKLKTQLSTQRGETIFNLYQGTVKENVKKMVSVMRAHNDPRGKQLGQEMVVNEAAIRDFFDTLATTQKRFVKNNLQQLIAAARTSNVVNPIAVAADSDDIFEEVFAQVQRLGGAELSN